MVSDKMLQQTKEHSRVRRGVGQRRSHRIRFQSNVWYKGYLPVKNGTKGAASASYLSPVTEVQSTDLWSLRSATYILILLFPTQDSSYITLILD
eukprot:scaffold559_cov358-Prasinococcus_capsulatus_cf.AAC.4